PQGGSNHSSPLEGEPKEAKPALVGGAETVIGDHNWIMAYVHIAHDCIVGNQTVFANNATLAGHVRVDDGAILGGFTGVHQFCRIGGHSFAAISSVIIKDVPPFVMLSGNPATPSGLNTTGLKRHGFSSQQIDDIKQAYKCVYRKGLLLKDALKELEALGKKADELQYFYDFIRGSERGIIR
ncbi:MAG: acyl-ACP--UDP-N-acetylglucosamine O-acyltransferase, partial [Gammaproteobacteria bacterium]